MNKDRLIALAEYTKEHIDEFDMSLFNKCFIGMAYQMYVGHNSPLQMTLSKFEDIFELSFELGFKLCYGKINATPEEALLTLDILIETGEVIW